MKTVWMIKCYHNTKDPKKVYGLGWKQLPRQEAEALIKNGFASDPLQGELGMDVPDYGCIKK